MSSEPGKPVFERRRITRQKSFLRGTIYFNNRINALDCLVRDISPYGARLVFTDSVTTPDNLELHIPQKDQTLRVHVIWRHAHEAGVAFAQATHTEPAAEAAAAPDHALAERVARLELEIASLKRLLKKLKADAGPEFDVA